MYVSHLSLADFRSYARLELPLEAGVTAFVGPNGQGKTNLVEAVGYVASLASHRVATDAPLVRFGAERAVVRAAVVVDGRPQLVEIELNPGRPNRARVNRAAVPRPREVAGLLKTVLFAPEDLALVKGDPSERRRFLDELLTIRAPRLAGVRSDYDRVLKQRNALLKSAAVAGRRSESVLPTLEVWDSHLARAGADLLAARIELVTALGPLVGEAYTAVAGSGTAVIEYRASVELPEEPKPADLADAILAEIAKVRRNELDRGITLVGPHRDELALRLVQDGEPMTAKGYASHGESWSYALALRLGAYELLKADGSDPVLILDDVFAELDTRRRARLATLVGGAEQVLITAAVDDDVPAELAGARFSVADGEVAKTR